MQSADPAAPSGHIRSPGLSLSISDGIATLLLDRPDRRNAMNQQMWAAFPTLVARAMADPSVRLMILGSAAPGMFCAGADIAEFARDSGDSNWRAANQAAIRATQLALAGAAKPVIAAIDGDCIGAGCGLALAADIRIAAPAARFGITPAKLGLTYPLHDTRLLVALVGPGQAKRLLFTAMLIEAQEARAIGLVEVVADDPMAEAEALARRMLAASPFSQRALKATLGRIHAGVTDDDAQSSALFDAAFTGADFREGVAAFLEKRPPRFGT